MPKALLCCFLGWVLCISPTHAKTRRAEKLIPTPEALQEQLDYFTPKGLELAIRDMQQQFPEQMPDANDLLVKLASIRAALAEVKEGVLQREAHALAAARGFLAFQHEALTRNPLLEDGEILLIERVLDAKRARGFHDERVSKQGNGIPLGLPWRNTHSMLTIADPIHGWNNRIAILHDIQNSPALKEVYKTPEGAILTNLELHFNAADIMYTSIGKNDRWAIFELNLNRRTPQQITPGHDKVLDYVDSCYLPNGNVFLTGTTHINGLPCEGGTCPCTVPHLLDRQNNRMRLLGFDQESSWDPSVMNDGRVLYLRYEYTDLPHYYPRILFTCNPDGSNQRALYGSNSYWPNSFFGLRAIPGHPSKVIGTATGHHGLSRMGKLIILDPSQGHHEAEGVVQAIPGRGKLIKPEITDHLYRSDYPKALTPYPLNEYYHLVSMKLSPNGLWGIYLVDVFDNLTLLYQQEGNFYVDPILLTPRAVPPVIPQRVNENSQTATVYLQDIYFGPGLQDIPRGTVKALRVFSYVYPVTNTGSHDHVGIESGWDIKRILGTVPVEADGSASFEVPANVPIAVQPLDNDGAALQLMRSWFTAMPGERLSCIGCHETPLQTPLPKQTIASKQVPRQITPWRGPARPFDYETEVQPLLDRKCTGCHRENPPDLAIQYAQGRPIPRLTASPSGRFSHSYTLLQQFVNRPGPESDLHLLTPMDFHASSSALIQMLGTGHHGVVLTPDDLSILYTWIDLNVPYHGSIFEMSQMEMNGHWAKYELPYVKMPNQSMVLGCENSEQGIRRLYAKRMEVMKEAAGFVIDTEKELRDWRSQIRAHRIEPEVPSNRAVFAHHVDTPAKAQLPLAETNKKKLARDRAPFILDLDSAPGITLTWIPGNALLPLNGFHMATTELSNAQYAQFDKKHDSKYIARPGKDQGSRGHKANADKQPVIRISQRQALAFCDWLSNKTGHSIRLPSAQQWEHACRAGTETPFWFGQPECDFTSYANLADARLTVKGRNGVAGVPFDAIHDDGAVVTTEIGSYLPNPWGLYNMHGNVSEWIRTERNGKVIASGGSWRDRPKQATSETRRYFESYQPTLFTGFRIIVEP